MRWLGKGKTGKKSDHSENFLPQNNRDLIEVYTAGLCSAYSSGSV